MPTVLSTKILSPSQKNLLLNKGIALVEYNAVKILFQEFEISGPLKNAIITSRNSAQAIIKKNIFIERCFCVGEKTSEYLTENGFSVIEVANYGTELADIIVKKYPEENFVFFCGDKRREELPSVLKMKDIHLDEIEVYKSVLNIKTFSQEFEGILFYSPSGVESFISKNRIRDAIAFCIGTTTASQAKKYSDNTIIATKPSIENVIVQVVKKFKHD